MSKSYDIQIVKGAASKPTCTAREIYFGGEDFEEIRETVTTVSTVTIKPGSVRLAILPELLITTPCPVCFESLARLDCVKLQTIRRRNDVCSQTSEFIVKNRDDFVILNVKNEVSECVKRSNKFSFTDMECKEVMKVYYTKMFLGFKVKVEAPVGRLIGQIKSRSILPGINLEVSDECNLLVYRVSGPWLGCRAPFSKSQVEYKIKSANHNTSCKTKEDYLGNVCRLISRCETFTLEFPMYLETKYKALLVATVLVLMTRE